MTPAFLVFGYRICVSDRLFEWYAAGTLALISICLAAPNVVLTGGFAILRDRGVSPEVCAAAFAFVATMRLAALVANGNIPVYGPRIRAASAAACVLIWFNLALALAYDYAVDSRLSLGLPIYVMLTACDMYSATRATRDVGRCN